MGLTKQQREIRERRQAAADNAATGDTKKVLDSWRELYEAAIKEVREPDGSWDVRKVRAEMAKRIATDDPKFAKKVAYMMWRRFDRAASLRAKNFASAKP